MKRCKYCKKIIWWWQSEYLGLPAAHKYCDLIHFIEQTEKLVKKGLCNPQWKEGQDKLREKNAYY